MAKNNSNNSNNNNKKSKKSKQKTSSTPKKEPTYEETRQALKEMDRDLVPFFISDPSNPAELIVNEGLQASKAANKPKKTRAKTKETSKMQVREFKDGYFVANHDIDVDSSSKNQKQIDNETFGSNVSFLNSNSGSNSPSVLTWQQQLQMKNNKNKNNSDNDRKSRKRRKSALPKTKSNSSLASTDLRIQTPLVVEAEVPNLHASPASRRNGKVQTTTMVPLTVTQATGLYSQQQPLPRTSLGMDRGSTFGVKPQSVQSVPKAVAFPSDDLSYLEETVGLLTPNDLMESLSAISSAPASAPAAPEPSSLHYTNPFFEMEANQGGNSDHSSSRQRHRQRSQFYHPEQHEVVHSSDNSGGSPQSPPTVTEDDILASMDINIDKGENKKYAGASFSVAPAPSSLPIPDFSGEVDIFPSSTGTRIAVSNHHEAELMPQISAPADHLNVEQALRNMLNIN